MKHFTASQFWQCFNALPVEIQNLARQNFELLKRNPSHASLHFKSVSHGRFRSVRVGLQYRALGIPVPDGVQWFWIGAHAEYDRLIK
ncbi:MAG TPA: hypothetical protein VMJ32_00655 [Pirellulales bacterium]|nr:hypothetical protein [Pirellulales bacterium]